MLFPFFFGFAATAAAQQQEPPDPDRSCLGRSPPTKEIRIKNNSPDTIFPVISVPIYDRNQAPSGGKDNRSADLWMQAQCGITEQDADNRRFNTTKVYRAYINLQGGVGTTGVPPGSTVRITVPFWTQLKDVKQGDLGRTDDQFIDWWNSSRIYLFYGRTTARTDLLGSAVNSAMLDGEPQDIDFGKNIPNQIKPICTIDTQPPTNCQIVFKTHKIEPRVNIPFQLQEYTFASAEGPPPGGTAAKFWIQKRWVNYNVSSLDSVYLPVAMGPILNGVNPTDASKYLGDAASVKDFNEEIRKFSNNGSGWPYFIPIYFADQSQESPEKWPPLENKGPGGPKFPSCSFINPFTDTSPTITPYLFPKIPGTANFLIESYRIAWIKDNKDKEKDKEKLVRGTLVPPTLSSQPSNFASHPNYNINRCDAVGVPAFTDPPGLGTNGKALVDLWTKCTTTNDQSDTCNKIRQVNQFFLDNFKLNPSCTATPDQPAVMFAVYGWVPIKFPLYPKENEKICEGPALVTQKDAYNKAILTYCELQYNYLTPNLPQELVFNPYTKLIHGTLGSSAYAFSIDDAQAFRHIEAPGVIITIGGTSGLDDPTPTPLPNGNPADPNYFLKFCREGVK